MAANSDLDISRGIDRYKHVLLLIVLIFVVLSILSVVWLRKVESYEVGVKTVNIGLHKGVEDKIYGPGRYVVVPFLQRFNTFDVRIQNLYMPKSDLSFKTSDGNDVWVEVTVLHRIEPEMAPSVLKNFGPGDAYVRNRLYPLTRDIIRTKLGELTTEEFYNSIIREKKARETEAFLNEKLKGSGIRVVNVLVKEYNFTEAYEKRIREKKLADQDVLVQEARRRAAEEEAKRQRIVAEGEAAAAVELARGENEAKKILAEARRYYKEREAEGILALKNAEAKGKRLLSRAYAGVGGRRAVGIEMAKRLKNVEIVVLPSAGKEGLNPLDVEKMLKFMGVK